ncbi:MULTISPECIES: hypothetical protein [Burkholderia cepacia complex]|uniref:hypothetical protein n=1 Tax=Burkholderia cenocepacia TaxID=95486 RepID=UPI002239115F|nr:hypothetical protein [Burkholderia cenocepacia]MCW5156402.1 hypothetical protein [Burkholderia cenocepacia]
METRTLGREGYFDDTKPTKSESIRQSLHNNDTNDAVKKASEIRKEYYSQKVELQK